MQWSSSVTGGCLAGCSLVPHKLAKECVQSWAESPAELQGDASDSSPPFALPYLIAFVRSSLCRSRRLFLSFSHGLRVMKSFRIDCEVGADVRRPWVLPCIHTNPWFRRRKHRSRDAIPASQQTLWIMWHPTSCSVARSPPMRRLSACCAVWSLSLMLAQSPLHHREVQSYPCVDAEFHRHPVEHILGLRSS